MTVPTGSRRRGVSREVRLRRTIVGALVLATATSSVVAFARNSDASTRPPEVSRAAATATAAPTATPRRTLPTPAPTTSSAASTTASSTPSHDKKSATATRPADSPDKGTGTFAAVHVPGKPSSAKGRTVTYRLEVERGLHADTAAIAKTVRDVLLDPRGWQSVDHVRFVQSPKKAKITIYVASPQTTDKLCYPAKTEGKWSCFNQGKAVLNYRRWLKAVPGFDGNVTGYREYLVNHEVGHGLGHTHRTCPGKGQPAPVMQEQSMGLHGCKAWFWPMSPAEAAKVTKS